METKRDIKTVAMIIVCCLGIYLCCFVAANYFDQSSNDLQNLIHRTKDSVKVFKDDRDRWHFRSDVMEVRNAETRKLLAKNDQTMQVLMGEFATVKKSLRNLEYLNVAGMRSDYEFQPGYRDTIYIVNKDTIPAQVAIKTDSAGWYSFEAIVANNQIKHLRLNTKDSLSTVITWRRRWLFGRKHYSQEILSHNPHTKVAYSRAVLFKH